MKPLLLLALFAGCSGPKPDAGRLTLTVTDNKTRTYTLDSVSGLCGWYTPKDQPFEFTQQCLQLDNPPRTGVGIIGEVIRRANNEPLEAFVHGQTCGSGEFRTVDEAKRCVEGTLRLQRGMRK